MKRRLFSILTALALCLSLCPNWAFAWEGEPGTADVPTPIDEPAANGTQIGDSNLYCTLEDGTLTISGTGDMPDFTAFDKSPWNDSKAQITTVVIKSGVTSIGWNAFLNCDVLQSVEIPGSVTSLGYQAFMSCDALTSITIPEGVTLIDSSAFQQCGELSSVTIPASVTKIGQQAFSGCWSLTSVTFAGRTAPTLGWIAFDTDDQRLPHSDPLTINVPHGAVGYTEENGWPVVTPDPNHAFDENGLCLCGEQAAAKVEAGSDITYYSTIESAWDAALAAQSATITLLADVTTAVDSNSLTMDDAAAHIILDGNGKTFYSNVICQFNLINGKLTLQNCTVNGSNKDRILNIHPTGQVELKGSTVNETIKTPAIDVKGQITMDAGSKIIGVAMFDAQAQQLTAGTFSNNDDKPIWCTYGITLGTLLKNYNTTTEPHYAYFSDGTPILDVLELEQFPTKYKTVTIGECHHEGEGVCTYEPVIVDGETIPGWHKMTCRACGYTKQEACTLGAYTSVDAETHKQTCSVCGLDTVEQHHMTQTTPATEGLTTTFTRPCYDCEYVQNLGTITQSASDITVTYGQITENMSLAADLADGITCTYQWSGPYVTGETTANALAIPTNLTATITDNNSYPFTCVVTLKQGNTSLYGQPFQFNVRVDPTQLPDVFTLASESVTYSGAPQRPEVTASDGLTFGRDYTVDYSNNTNAGEATVTITGNFNCTGTVTKMFTIEKATPDINGLAVSLFYGQKLSESTVTGSATNPNTPSVTVAGKLTWASPDAQPTGEGVELFTATFTPDDTDNYTTALALPTVTVNPAEPEITLTAPAYQQKGKEVTVTCTVKNRYDGTMDDVPAVTLTYKVGDGAPQTITGSSFTIPDTADVGDVITITAATAADGQKYLAASRTATVTVTDKTPVEITGVSVTGRPYNGEPISLTGAPAFQTLEGAPVTVDDEDVTYTWSSGEAPTNAGSYTLVITVGGDTYIGTLSLDFTIAKATITITAADKSAAAGNAKPELTYTVSGLVGEDALSTAPTLTCDADMDTVGSYPITAAGATVPNTTNYNEEIIYVDGTLTVTATPAPAPDSGSTYVPFTPGAPSTAATAPTVTVPVSGDANTVRVSASVSGSAATVSRIDTTQLENVISGSAQTSTVEIDFTGLGKTIDTVHLPTDAIAEIAAAAQDKVVGGLTVKLSDSEISFDGNALAAIQAQAGSQLTLIVTPAKSGDLNARQKEAVGSAQVYDLTLQSNGRAITDFRGGCVTASLPYTLAAGQTPSGVVVYYLDSTGNITPCTTTYDVIRQAAVFTTSHLSLYFVAMTQRP